MHRLLPRSVVRGVPAGRAPRGPWGGSVFKVRPSKRRGIFFSFWHLALVLLCLIIFLQMPALCIRPAFVYALTLPRFFQKNIKKSTAEPPHIAETGLHGFVLFFRILLGRPGVRALLRCVFACRGCAAMTSQFSLNLRGLRIMWM